MLRKALRTVVVLILAMTRGVTVVIHEYGNSESTTFHSLSHFHPLVRWSASGVQGVQLGTGSWVATVRARPRRS